MWPFSSLNCWVFDLCRNSLHLDLNLSSLSLSLSLSLPFHFHFFFQLSSLIQSSPRYPPQAHSSSPSQPPQSTWLLYYLSTNPFRLLDNTSRLGTRVAVSNLKFWAEVWLVLGLSLCLSFCFEREITWKWIEWSWINRNDRHDSDSHTENRCTRLPRPLEKRTLNHDIKIKPSILLRDVRCNFLELEVTIYGTGVV